MPLYHLYYVPSDGSTPDSLTLESKVWPPPDEFVHEGQRYTLKNQSPDIKETKTEKLGAFYNWVGPVEGRVVPLKVTMKGTSRMTAEKDAAP